MCCITSHLHVLRSCKQDYEVFVVVTCSNSSTTHLINSTHMGAIFTPICTMYWMDSYILPM